MAQYPAVNLTRLQIASRAVLEANVIPDFLWIAVGTPGALCAIINLVTVLAPRSRSTLTGVHYQNVAHLAIAELFNNFSHLVTAIRELSITLSGQTDVLSIAACGAKGLFNTLAINVVGGQTVALAGSRLFALAFPIQFRKFNLMGKVQWFNYGFWLVGVLVTVIAGLGLAEGPLIPACKFSLTFKTWGQQWPTAVANVFGGMIVLMTVAMIGILIYRMRARGRLAEGQKALDKFEMMVAKIGVFVGLQYAVIFLAPCIVSQIYLMSSNPALAYTVQPIATANWGLHSIVQFLIYVSTDRSYRICLMNLLTVRASRVDPI